MRLKRAITVFFLVLGLALGQAVSVAQATEQAFAKPCPMQHQDGHQQDSDCPCCADDCTGAMIGCSAKCSPSNGAAALPASEAVFSSSDARVHGFAQGIYDPFNSRPPPPIPIV